MANMTRLPDDAAAAVLAELAWVRRLAHGLLHDAALAEDVAQDTWLAARNHPPAELTSRRGLRAWLRTVVQNRVHRLRRSELRRRSREQSARGVATEDPADVAARAQLQQQVTAAVMALEEPFRSALLWRYLDELPATEIARRQGISHDAARQRISRGLARLRQQFEREHPGGFAAFCVAWTDVLGVPPAPFAAWSLFAWILMKKWTLSLAAVLGVVLWSVWPATTPSSQPIQPGTGVAPATATASGSEPERPLGRTAVPTAAAPLVVAVVDDAGRPWPDLHVVALQRGELVEAGTTDREGCARFPAALVADEWLFAVRGGGVVRRPRGSELGQAIALARGERVEGTVRGEGPPNLVLVLQHDVAQAAFAELGPKVLAHLAALGLTATTVELPVDAAGTFSAHALAADWSGALRGPAGSLLREPTGMGAVEDDALLLPSPLSGLLLELVMPRVVRGRVQVEGLPAVGYQVAAAVGREQRRVAACEVRSDPAGGFELPVCDLEPGQPLPVRLLVTGDGGCLLERGFELPAGRGPHDVGALVLRDGHRLRLVGDAGTGVVDADVSVIVDVGLVVRQRSDATGWVRFPALPSGVATLRVTAAGFATVRQPLPAESDTTVVMVRSGALVVQVVAADGASSGARTVRLTADRSPFRAVEPVAEGRASTAFAATFELEDGRVALVDLLPAVLVHLQAQDVLGAPLGGLDAVTPATAVTERVTLTTTIRPARLTGFVRDELDHPVARARVHVEADGFAAQARTDGQGRFELAMRRHVDDAHVEVHHPAYVPWLHNGPLDRTDDGLRVTLQRGRRLDVRVLQANGSPLDGIAVLAEFGERGNAVGKAQGAGTFAFPMVPRVGGEVSVELGGQRFAVPVGALDTVAELRVPELGFVTVHRALEGADDAGTRTCVVVTTGNGVVTRRYFAPDGAAIELALPTGDYRLQLERRWLGQRRTEFVGEARTVALRPGERSDVVLGQ